MAFSCCGLVCEIGISLTTYYRRRTLDCGSQTLRRSRTGQAFEKLPEVRVLVFEPAGAPRPEVMVKEKRAPGMTPGRAVLVELMPRYLAAVMDPFITLLEIHKLMYFMQQAGENLRLNYEKGTYGPYAKNLRHVLSVIEGHFIRVMGMPRTIHSGPYNFFRACPNRPAPSFDPTLIHRLDSTGSRSRSEEHTSELQSPMYLVCRLLLEKKI